jgi:hypothetical protein
LSARLYNGLAESWQDFINISSDLDTMLNSEEGIRFALRISAEKGGE